MQKSFAHLCKTYKNNKNKHHHHREIRTSIRLLSIHPFLSFSISFFLSCARVLLIQRTDTHKHTHTHIN